MKPIITLLVFLNCSFSLCASPVETDLSKNVKNEILDQIEDILTITNFNLVPNIDTSNEKFCTLSAHVNGKMSALSGLIKATIYMWEDRSETVVFDLSRHAGVLRGFSAITNLCEVDNTNLPAYFSRVIERLKNIKSVVLSEF